MKISTNRVTRAAAFAIGIGITAMQLSAQQGTFNLPVKAHWGNAILEPGEHAVAVPEASAQTIVYLRSDSNTQMTTPFSVERGDSTNRSYLHLARVNGEYYVDQYKSGATGKTFLFSKPKSPSATHGPIEEESTLVAVTNN